MTTIGVPPLPRNSHSQVLFVLATHRTKVHWQKLYPTKPKIWFWQKTAVKAPSLHYLLLSFDKIKCQIDFCPLCQWRLLQKRETPLGSANRLEKSLRCLLFWKKSVGIFSTPPLLDTCFFQSFPGCPRNFLFFAWLLQKWPLFSFANNEMFLEALRLKNVLWKGKLSSYQVKFWVVGIPFEKSEAAWEISWMSAGGFQALNGRLRGSLSYMIGGGGGIKSLFFLMEKSKL